MAAEVTCPRCNGAVQTDWDWCHACGFDPEGLKPRNWTPPPSAGSGPPSAGVSRTFPPPVGASPPTFAPPMFRGASPQVARPRSGSTAVMVVKVLGILGVAFVALIAVLVLAVSLIGTSASVQTTSLDGNDPSTVASTAPTWTTWSPTDGSFVVEFPGAPITEPVVQDDVKFGRGQAAVHERGPTLYMVMYFDIADGYYFDDPQAAMNGALDGMANEAGFVYETREPSQFGYLPSQNFTGTADVAGQTRTVQGVAFVSGRRTVIMVSAAVVGTLVDHERFIASFALR